jgi:hypothetical protein
MKAGREKARAERTRPRSNQQPELAEVKIKQTPFINTDNDVSFIWSMNGKRTDNS